MAERKRPGNFKRLKKDETFRGIALFEPDPELKENPGFFEYYDHWDQQGNTFVPCVGDGCIFCAAGQNPSTRAMTLWYFPDEDNNERFKIFTANFRLIDDFADISEEEDGLMGLKIRVRRKDDQGTYSARPLTDKRLSQAQLKKLIAEGVETVGDFEELMDRTLQRQLERLKAVEALEDDDEDYDEDEDEEEEEKPARRRGRAKSSEAEEEEEEEEDDEEEEEEDDEDEDEPEDDEEEESDDDEEEEAEEEEEESEDGDAELEGVTLTVSSVDRENEEIKVKDAKGNSFVLFLEADLEVDFDEIKRGGKLKVDAVRDDEDDLVATKIAVVKQRSRSRASSSNAKKPATRRAAKTTTTRSRSRSK